MVKPHDTATFEKACEIVGIVNNKSVGVLFVNVDIDIVAMFRKRYIPTCR